MPEENQLHVQSESYTNNITILEPHLLYFEREDCRREHTLEFDAFPNLWSLGIGEVHPELMGIHRHGNVIRRKGLWATFIPPFSLIHWELAPIPFTWRAFISDAPLPEGLPKEPVAFPWNELWQPKTISEILARVSSVDHYESIAKEEEVSSVAEKTRDYINRHFQDATKLADIAKELQFSHSVMTRAFKKAYGLSPIAYRNKLRVFESLKHLVFSGQSVVETSQAVGFGDTSRFNKQFRSQINAVPSQFMPTRKSLKDSESR